jgi:hypothetical protein
MRFTKRTQVPVDSAAVTQRALTDASMRGFVNTIVFHRYRNLT